jgi:Family of unknown function (DUF5309)
MAEVVVGSYVDTQEIVADEKVIDMDPKMRLLDPDQTQFTTMTSRMGSRAATREKVNWLEETYVLDVYTASAYTSGATSVTITAAAESRAIQPNDVLRNMRTGQAMIVDVVVPGTGVLTVRPQGTNAAGNAGDKLLYVGNAYPQGANIGAPKYSARVLGFNYTQIFREPWSFTGTATAIELYGGGEPAKEAARKAVEFKRQIEHNGFFGSRFFTTAVNAPNTGDPQGGAGGLIEFIATNKQNVGGELTSDFLDLFLATVLAKGSSDKVIFTGTVGAYYISRFHRSGQGAFWKPSNESVHGVKVDGFISGVFGYQLPVVVKKEWANYPSGANGYNGNLFVVDMTNIERRPLRDRDTKLLTNRQGPGEDRVAAEYLCEMSWTIAQERTHGLLTGIA